MSISLSAKQAALLDETCDEWRRIVRSCGTFDRRAAEAAILRAYDLCAFDPPKVVWCESPLSFTLTRTLFDDIRFQPSERKRTALLRGIPALLRRRLPEQLAASVAASIDATFASGMPVGTKRDVQSKLCQSAAAQTRGRIPKDLWRHVIGAIQERIGGDIRQSTSHVFGAVARSIPLLTTQHGWRNFLWPFRAEWDRWTRLMGNAFSRSNERFRYDELARSAYFRELGLWDEMSPLQPLEQLAQWAHGLWTDQDICWLLARPLALHLDERADLHWLSGPALLFPDGWSVHAIAGVQVPAHVVEQPATITIREIDQERNAEVRRVMIERYGLARYLIDGAAIILAKDDRGTLWRKELPGDEPLVMVQLRNSSPEPDGSFKEYFLRVPPDMRTPAEAVAWSFNLTEGDYRPLIET